MGQTTITAYVRVEGEKRPVSFIVEAEGEGTLKEAEALLRALLDSHRGFMQEEGESLLAQSLLEFLQKEHIAGSWGEAMRIVVRGSVRRKDDSGQWKVVAAKDAVMRPGWWKVFRKGLFLIGEDGTLEKRLNGKGPFKSLAFGKGVYMNSN